MVQIAMDGVERDHPAPGTGATRRQCLAGLALLPFAGSRAWADAGPLAPAPDGARVVALDWGLAATLLALGVTPLGTPVPRWYRRSVIEPAMPESVANVGLLFTPNIEVLAELAPSLIAITPGLRRAAAMLARTGPVVEIDLFQPGPNALARANRGTVRLAAAFGAEARGERLVAETAAALAAARTALAQLSDRPIAVISPVDDRHMALFTAGSLYHDVLLHLGLTSALPAATGTDSIVVGIDALRQFSDCRLLLIDSPTAPGLAARIQSSRLWSAFAFVREERIHCIAPVLGSAGLPAAVRFARLMGEALRALPVPSRRG